MTMFLVSTFVAVLFLVADFALGVKVGRMLKRDEPDDDFPPMPRRLNVPPHQPHTPPSEAGRDTDVDPAS